MTAIAGGLALGRDGVAARADRATVAGSESMLRAMGARASGPHESWQAPDGGAWLGVASHDWESTLAPTARVERRGRVALVADATLYHRADLRRRLVSRGCELPLEASHGALILAAYDAFGEDCAAMLEGDFAFLLFDEARGRLVAARDFTGRRTLFHARTTHGFVCASTIGGVLAAGVPAEPSMAALAAVAAGLWLHSHETAYRGVEELEAGHLLIADAQGVRVRRHWDPPMTTGRRREPLRESAAELQSLLVDAVRERLAPDGATAVSLSGGWDSPSVYGAGQLALASGAPGSLRPVSISYPPGDPGREDEIISRILARFGASAEWIDVDGVPVMDPRAREEAAAREEPFAHAYEHWNRALSRGARRAGARVILDGTGGDQLFQVSDIYLTELFRRGQWLELRRQWRAREDRGARAFYHAAVRRGLPRWATGAIARARGAMPAPHYLERQPPFWFRGAFMREHGVLERERRARPALPTHDLVLAEAHAFLRFPFYTRIMRLLSGFALEEGVELRAPLLDDRVVRFAVARPWNERADGRETKVLLRASMRDVLPDEVLAPRPERTGVTSGYLLRQLRGPARPWFEAMLADPVLADVGMIDPARLRRAWEHLQGHDDVDLGGRLFFTLQADLWLRARTR